MKLIMNLIEYQKYDSVYSTWDKIPFIKNSDDVIDTIIKRIVDIIGIEKDKLEINRLKPKIEIIFPNNVLRLLRVRIPLNKVLLYPLNNYRLKFKFEIGIKQVQRIRIRLTELNCETYQSMPDNLIRYKKDILGSWLKEIKFTNHFSKKDIDKMIVGNNMSIDSYLFYEDQLDLKSYGCVAGIWTFYHCYLKLRLLVELVTSDKIWSGKNTTNDSALPNYCASYGFNTRIDYKDKFNEEFYLRTDHKTREYIKKRIENQNFKWTLGYSYYDILRYDSDKYNVIKSNQTLIFISYKFTDKYFEENKLEDNYLEKSMRVCGLLNNFPELKWKRERTNNTVTFNYNNLLITGEEDRDLKIIVITNVETV